MGLVFRRLTNLIAIRKCCFPVLSWTWPDNINYRNHTANYGTGFPRSKKDIMHTNQ